MGVRQTCAAWDVSVVLAWSSGRGQGAMALSRESARRWRSERVGGLRGDHTQARFTRYTFI